MNRTPTQIRFLVLDQSYVGAARRSVRALAEQIGLSGEPLARLDIITTELATNLAKHVSGGGEIIAIDSSANDVGTIQLLSIDRGNGIADVENVLIDGFSTAGTMGAGLGAIKRQADSFGFSSVPGKGTCIHCIVSQDYQAFDKAARGQIELGAISLPRIGEEKCGDGISAACSDGTTSILVVDGLGHGEGAAEAADRAMHVFSKTPFAELRSTAEEIHRQLAGTRGAAIALVKIEQSNSKVYFVGVGNIECRIFTRYSSRGCVSSQGIVGGRIGSLKEYTYDWEPESCLLMYSDGIKSSAQLCNAQTKSAVLAAAEVYRDYYRTTDDTTVVVVKDTWRK